MNVRSDEELMQSVRDGDLDAFEQLVLRHQAKAWRVAYRFTGDAAEAEDLETLSRALGVTAARLAAWRDEFLAGGTAGLKTRHDPDEPRHEELVRLKVKIGDLTMANELLEEKTDRLEAGLPLPPRQLFQHGFPTCRPIPARPEGRLAPLWQGSQRTRR